MDVSGRSDRLRLALAMVEAEDFDAGAEALRELIPDLDGRELLDALLALGRASMWTERTDEALACAERSIELADAADDPVQAADGGQGVAVDVHHIREVKATDLPPADVYLFSSPGRFGRPIREVRRFLKDVTLPAGTRYALLTTEMGPKLNKRTGLMPTQEEICRYQHVRPIINEALQGKGLIEVAEDKVYVTEIKGPLEPGWREKVAAFAALIPRSASAST